MSEQRITVAVRIRPTIDRERYETVCARKADDGTTVIIKPEENAANMGETSTFEFDYVFGESDDQVAVYEESVQELVDHALSGFNATVFTYGQTGSGKTYTLLGNISASHTVNDESGIFLRVFNDLFSYKESVSDRLHLKITLAALELYVEEVMDLLANKRKLKLRETPEETLAMGLRTVEVHSMSDVIANFELANSFRSVTATRMNDSSSRSHALFFVDVFQIPVVQNIDIPPLAELIDENGLPLPNVVPGLTRSRIALVDLAGSERVKRSGVSGQAMVEAQAINKSLSTLGTVINAMYVQASHIPFRESKLTKLLKTSFTDTTSRLLLIGQLAPPTASAPESLSTLRFCDRVKGLKAGQVAGFSDPAEETRFLQTLRTAEELTAELRIVHVMYDHQPTRVRTLAALKGDSVEDERAAAEAALRQADAPHAAERRAEAELRALELQAAQDRDAEVERFVLRMNGMIEEYEQVALAVKAEKKAAKRTKEENDAAAEALLHEAKKAKKARVKEEARVQAAREQLSAAQSAEAELDAAITAAQVPDEPALGGEAATTEGGEVEEARHELVSCFFNHVTELNRLHALYVSRLAATARQRSEVRRMKLLSSSLVSEGTLLYDILDFLVERAVDIAEGNVPSNAGWCWHDVDGLSRRLLGADQFYPPLLCSSEGQDEGGRGWSPPAEPEEYHSITFLSSDESDGVHSHHKAETRRLRRLAARRHNAGDGAASGDLYASDEDSGGGESDEEDSESDATREPQVSMTASQAADGQSAAHASGGQDEGGAEDAARPTVRQAAWADAPDSERAASPLVVQPATTVAPEQGQEEVQHEEQEAAEQIPDAASAPVTATVGSEDGPMREAERAATATAASSTPRGVDEAGSLGEPKTAGPESTTPGAERDVDGSEKPRRHHRHRHHHRRTGSQAAPVDGSRSLGETAGDVGAEGQVGQVQDAAAAAVETASVEARASQNGTSPGSSELEVPGHATVTGNNSPQTSSDLPSTAPSSTNDTARGRQAAEEDGDDLKYLMEVYDSPTLVQNLVKFLRGGTVMLKHGRSGKPHKRLFWVSTSNGRKELLWMKPNARNAERSSIELSEVSYIELGCFSKVFKRHPIFPSDPAFFRCFSVGLKGGGRTVDVVASTTPDYEAWVVGLAHLVGVDPDWGGKLDITKDPGFEQLTFFESNLCESNYVHPTDYLILKKEVQQRALHTLQVLEECGNDAVKAFEKLGGIHLPAIDSKGALYMTKGELRFVSPHLGLDIFRISRIWILLQQMNLVYDDKFVPATAFGVTQR